MRPSLSLEAGVTKQSHRPGSAVRCGSGTCWPFGCCTKHSKCDSGRAGKGRKEIKFYLFENGLAFARKKYSWQRNGPLTHSLTHIHSHSHTHTCVYRWIIEACSTPLPSYEKSWLLSSDFIFAQRSQRHGCMGGSRDARAPPIDRSSSRHRSMHGRLLTLAPYLPRGVLLFKSEPNGCNAPPLHGTVCSHCSAHCNITQSLFLVYERVQDEETVSVDEWQCVM